MSKFSRDKGIRGERAIVRFLQARGFAAEKISGMYKSGPDLDRAGSRHRPCGRGEGRADGFRELYRWLIDRDILIVRADRSEPLVVLPLKLAAEIAARAGAQ